MNYNNLCFSCFSEKSAGESVCPKCGHRHDTNSGAPNCLRPGMLLKNRYVVGIALGVGGFGITYKCLDTKIGGICAVKEYFPANFAVRSMPARTVSVAEQNVERYNKIMRRFVEEAEMLKTFRHPNIITIYDSFFENNTAYYVMEYCDGVDLRRYTNNFSRRLGYGEGMNILYQIMNGLEYIHKKGVLHRDIAPDNIYITKNNSVKILDFGAARREMDQLNRELSAIVKVGYAPIEQYGGRGKQGPYTDIYALGATFYHLFTSIIPVESTQRVSEDTLEPFSRLRPDLPENLKYCIEKCMEITTAKRVADIEEMKGILGLGRGSVRIDPPGEKPVKKPPKDIGQSGAKAPASAGKANVSRRIGAYMIDLAIWLAVYFTVIIGAFGVSVVSAELGLLFPIVFTIINTISEIITSTTAGKGLLKMQVRGGSGEKATAGQILLRNIVKMLNIFVVVFSENDELLEDRATGSIVCMKG